MIVGLFLIVKCVKSRFLLERRRRKWIFVFGMCFNVVVKFVIMVRLEKYLFVWFVLKECFFYWYRLRECWKYIEIFFESSYENDVEVMERFIWIKLVWNENRFCMDDCREL